MNRRPKPSAVIFAKDVAVLAQFYREVAEMTEVNSDQDKVVLDEHGFQLVIHGIPEIIAESIAISTPPAVREETPIKICLPVMTIEAARSKAAKLGGQVAPKAQEWSARGFRACDAYDPEGNVFQVRESAD
jgi:predicted enzyme related to lactoylglutathione lyase